MFCVFGETASFLTLKSTCNSFTSQLYSTQNSIASMDYPNSTFSSSTADGGAPNDSLVSLESM